MALAACTNALDSEVYDLELRAYPAIGAIQRPALHAHVAVCSVAMPCCLMPCCAVPCRAHLFAT